MQQKCTIRNQLIKKGMAVIGIAETILCIILFWESYIDIKKKQVWIWLPLLAAVVGILCIIIEKRVSIKELIICLGITAVFWVISKVSKEALGMGDVWIIGSILIVMGVMNGVGILFLSFLLAAVYGGILLVVKKKGKHITFPFVPFLFLGTMGGVWMG